MIGRIHHLIAVLTVTPPTI